MAGHALTTEALFLRVAGIDQQDASVERWQRIEDNKENEELENTVEYSGGVLEQFYENSADGAQTDDFIRFKNIPIDSSQGGLQDSESLRDYIEREIANHNVVYQNGEPYIRNPVYQNNLISERDAQIIMGNDMFTFNNNNDDEDEGYTTEALFMRVPVSKQEGAREWK